MSAPPKPFTRVQTRRAPNEELQSDGSLTPIETTAGLARIKHKSSAISLLNRKETLKSGAETGTDATNATGQLDTPITQDMGDLSITLNDKGVQRSVALKDIRAGHTYDGNDPMC